MKVEVLPASAINTFVEVKDSVSGLYGTGTDICGARAYAEMIDTDGSGNFVIYDTATHPWYTRDNGEIIIETSDNQYVNYATNTFGIYGTTGYTINFETCLANYDPFLVPCRVETFLVEIMECEIINFEIDGTQTDITVDIFSALHYGALCQISTTFTLHNCT